ncbi:thermonuclease family protein [Hyphococcus flavus]|uniref:Thermonuclease family protein n=1 Tax=Hyphococcus flavus TaxID=1866326 RepID=A0AAE9ZF06_9PROT|nr:thermonuclease family protein [Hyphococcus flavus]WDI31638.1 thermonuclease family protein [Hyphococcus flavus]
MKRRAFIAGAASFCAIRANAQTPVVNATALSGDRFTVGDDEYQLADVIAPPLYTLKKTPPAYFEAARQTLDSLLRQGVNIKEASPKSRWGVQPVIATMQASSRTLQEILCAAGAVRVAPQTENHDHIDRLLAAEKTTRDGRKGLWSLDSYSVYKATSANGAIGAYNIIEGTVVRAAKTRSRFYLNFGDDYRTDFTAGAVSRIYRRWAKDEFDLAALEGVRVRVRGFVEEINGPSIDLIHPKQIELLHARTA